MTLVQFLEDYHVQSLGLEFHAGDYCDLEHGEAISLCVAGRVRLAEAEQACEGNGRPRKRWMANMSRGSKSGPT